jgi:hypothetical protein
VHEAVHNDLYSFSARDLTASLVHTVGEVPPPRVGHASALVSSVLIVWGGDTKTNDGEKQDDGLYLLNLGMLSCASAAPIGLTLLPDNRSQRVDSRNDTRCDSRWQIRSCCHHVRYKILYIWRSSRW